MTTSRNRDADDLYRTLGVPAGASDEDIARAYRRLAREHHPDANPNAARDTFADLTDAYDVLRDPDRRRAYDNTRRARQHAATSPAGVRIPATRRDPDSKAAPSRTASKNPDVHPIELVLTFEQAALGATTRITLPAEAACPGCQGSGSGTHDGACPTCGGIGAAVRISGGVTIRNTCRSCEGTGQQPATPCPVCGGTGRTPRSREVQVHIPAGVDTGDTVRIPIDDTPGKGGVAVVRVEAHRYFGRAGNDLTLRLPITVAEAVLGAVVTVPTLTGAVAIRIPAGTSHGRTLRVRGRGVPAGERPGDLLVTVEIVIPTTLTDQQRAALEAFAAATESPRQHFES